MAKKNIEEQIIKAAATIFVKKGMDGARMQEIAAEAGINQALLHYYFRSKEKLFDAVFSEIINNFLKSVFSSISEKDNFKEFLYDFIVSYSQNITEHAELTKFILWEFQRGGKLMIKSLREAQLNGDSAPDFIIRKIEQAKKEGVIRPIDAQNFLLTLLSTVLYPFIARPIFENIFQIPDMTDAAFIDKRNQEVFDLLWSGIKQN